LLEVVREVVADVTIRSTSKLVVAKQNDTGSRFLNVRIKDGGKSLDMPSNSTVLLNVQRPDSSVGTFYGSVNDSGTVKVELNAWILEQPGTISCDISVVDENSVKLTTMTFYVEVEPAVCSDDDIEEPEEYSVIVDLLRRTDEAAQIAEKAAQDAEKLRTECEQATEEAEELLEMFKEQKIVGRTTPEGGEILNDYAENRAISLYSTAAGRRNFAGGKGYYWRIHDLSKNQYRLSLSQTEDIPPKNLTWQVGDILSFRAFVNSRIDFTEITAIDGNIITVAENPYTEDDLNVKIDEWDPSYISGWISSKPDDGEVNLGTGAFTAGVRNKAHGYGSAAFGAENEAVGYYSFASGFRNRSVGERSHTEGSNNEAYGASSHAEGYLCEATGDMAHAEGSHTKASGIHSHAEGLFAEANGDNSHAGGKGTIADQPNQTAIGSYNDNTTATDALFVVGKGTSDTDRSNAFTVNKNGTVTAGAGPVNPMDLVTLQYIRKELEKVFGFVEDTDYPGCHYKMVGENKEWLNPPMAVGVEYRTTERYQGKSVYTKLVDFGNLPTNSTKWVDHNVKATAFMRLEGKAGDTVFPRVGNGNWAEMGVMLTGNSIGVCVTGDSYNILATVQIWYTKD
jgi:hypothetical protein